MKKIKRTLYNWREYLSDEDKEALSFCASVLIVFTVIATIASFFCALVIFMT